MIGRADIEGSKSDVDMNAWPPQASYPCGNFSDTSRSKLPIGSLRKRSETKGSLGRAFAVVLVTEELDQASFCPYALREVSGHAELALGHLRYRLTDVPPQSNSPSENFPGTLDARTRAARPECVLRLDNERTGLLLTRGRT